jgi:hypothetical protein
VLAALIPFLMFGAWENYTGKMLARVNSMMSFVDRPAAEPAKPEMDQ